MTDNGPTRSRHERRNLTKMPSHDAWVKSRVDAVVSPRVWLVITMGEFVIDRVSAPTFPCTIPLLYVIVKAASDPCTINPHKSEFNW